MILLIDNYDSFVFNLGRYISELGTDPMVVRNDALSVAEIAALAPQGIVISPGPCTPNEAGISVETVLRLGAEVPILGVCLGHQCVAQAYGGLVRRARRPVHGKSAPVRHNGRGLFFGLPDPLRVGRYHSLVVELGADTDLTVDALGPEGEIMALSHRRLPVYGVQFHPESILTESGHGLLANFLKLAQAWHERRKSA